MAVSCPVKRYGYIRVTYLKQTKTNQKRRGQKGMKKHIKAKNKQIISFSRKRTVCVSKCLLLTARQIQLSRGRTPNLQKISKFDELLYSSFHTEVGEKR